MPLKRRIVLDGPIGAPEPPPKKQAYVGLSGEAENWAFTPNPADPRTWKLPIDTALNVGLAISRMGNYAYSQSIGATDNDRRQIRARIVKAGKKFNLSIIPTSWLMELEAAEKTFAHFFIEAFGIDIGKKIIYCINCNEIADFNADFDDRLITCCSCKRAVSFEQFKDEQNL